LDCDIPVQGAVAILLTTADRARSLKPRPAYLAGYGQRLHFEVAGRIGSLADYIEGGRSSAKLTWERSGFGPQDVDVAQIYDGFSASVIYGLESYGFCKEGEALDFIQDGRIALDGELPLNTFGGSLGTGRIHGLWHIIEGALQASGRAGFAPGQRGQRLIRRRQRPYRNRHDVHFRARALLRLANRNAETSSLT
jgi:acetyl-CoA acetyltransferase